MLTSVFGEFVDRISVSMHLVLITAYADVDFTKLMASAKVCFTRTLRTSLVFYAWECSYTRKTYEVDRRMSFSVVRRNDQTLDITPLLSGSSIAPQLHLNSSMAWSYHATLELLCLLEVGRVVVG